MATSGTSAAGTARAVGSAAWVAGGLFAAQLIGYALSLVAARALGPDGYGIFAALLGLVLIANTVGLGVQTAVARRIARLTPGEESPARAALRFGVLAGAAVTALLVVLTPVIVTLLHLPGPADALLLALAMLPITAAGAQIGIAQGRGDFVRTGLLYAAVSGIRPLGALLGALATRDVTGTMVGFAAGSLAGALLGWAIVAPLTRRGALPWPGLARETLHVTHAFLAFFVLTNVDVLLARHFLPAGAAGAYGVGVIIAKIAFFLPQFVAVVAFPRMAAESGNRPTVLASAATAALGLGMTAGCFLAGPLVVAVAGGPEYAGLAPDAWLFAALGSLLALAQVLLLSRLAEDDRRVVIVVWVAVAVLVGTVWLGPHDSVTVIVVTACSVAAALVAAGLASLRWAPGQTRGTGPAA